MGLFSKLKKNKDNTQNSTNFKTDDVYTTYQNTISSDNNSNIDEISESALSVSSHPDIKLKDKTFGDYVNNYVQLQENKAPIDMQLDNLKELVAFLRDYKEYCYSHPNKNYASYFSVYYEHCHNSKCSDFSLVESYETKLKNIIDNYDNLIQHENMVKYLPDELLQFLRDNNGILQKNIYKSFDDSLKEDIQIQLLQWARSGIINREKQGNTYIITIPSQ